jgi:hypothetical protein
MTAITSGLRPVGAADVSTEEAAGEEHVRGLSRGQTAAVALSVGLGVVVAGYGLAGSYVAISDLAARHGVPLARWVPAGLDGGLVAVVVLDLVLAWIGAPVGWLRQLVRVLSVGTVVTNAVAGWPDPVAVGLHAAAPVMLLAMLEAGHSVLLRRMGETRGTWREPIPPIRWLLAPWRTMLLWRRMALWQITSYRTAIDTELQLRRAMTLLRVHYGRRWRRRAPADLVWMLRNGAGANEACEHVRALVDVAERVESVVPPNSGAHRGATYVESRALGERQAGVPVNCSPSMPAGDPAVIVTDVDDRFDEARQLNRRHWMETGRPISAETLRQRLHIGASASRDLIRAVRAADRVAILESDP